MGWRLRQTQVEQPDKQPDHGVKYEHATQSKKPVNPVNSQPIRYGGGQRSQRGAQGAGQAVTGKQASTVLGETEARLYEAPSFEFGGFALGMVALLVAPKGWFNMSPNDSVIGYDVLAPFVIRIDYPRKRLWLKRVETGPIRFEGADYALAKQTGAFMTEVPGALLVWAVQPGSPAEKIGLRVGDAIVSMDSIEDRVTPPDVVLRRILEGNELLVARRQGDVLMDILLPEEPPPEP